jgi:hypothetical protein
MKSDIKIPQDEKKRHREIAIPEDQ